MNKKGYRLNDLLPVALVLVVGVIALAIGGDILAGIEDTQAGNTTGQNVSIGGQQAFSQIGDWLPTIGLVIAASLVIGILITSFAFGKR